VGRNGWRSYLSRLRTDAFRASALLSEQRFKFMKGLDVVRRGR
jgi:hypothetical protein